MKLYETIVLLALATGAAGACPAALAGELPAGTPDSGAAARGEVVPVVAQAAELPPSPDRARGSLPDKGLVALCALGLVAWQLRRKQATARSGQLYMTQGPRSVAGGVVARPEPAAGSPANAGIARAAR